MKKLLLVLFILLTITPFPAYAGNAMDSLNKNFEVERAFAELKDQLFTIEKKLEEINKKEESVFKDAAIDNAIIELQQKVRTKWRFSLNYYMLISSDDPKQFINTIDGLELAVQYKKFIFGLSYEELTTRMAGQTNDPFELIGITAGIKQPLWKGFSFLANVGVYIPQGDGVLHDEVDQAWEGYNRNWNNRYAYTEADKRYWDNCYSEYSAGIGVNIGIEYAYNITDKFSINAGLRYRYLKLKKKTAGYNDGQANGPRWEFITPEKIGGMFFLIGGGYQINEELSLGFETNFDNSELKFIF